MVSGTGKQPSLLPAWRAQACLLEGFPFTCQGNVAGPSPTTGWDQLAYAVEGFSTTPYRLHCGKGQGCGGRV